MGRQRPFTRPTWRTAWFVLASCGRVPSWLHAKPTPKDSTAGRAPSTTPSASVPLRLLLRRYVGPDTFALIGESAEARKLPASPVIDQLENISAQLRSVDSISVDGWCQAHAL